MSLGQLSAPVASELLRELMRPIHLLSIAMVTSSFQIHQRPMVERAQ